MPDISTNPRKIIAKLNADAEKVDDAAIKANMLEAAETVNYLLLLLHECADYIEGVKEYPEPPRFIIAVREALEK